MISDGDYHQHLCQCLRSDMIWKSLRLSFLLTVIIETIMVAKKVYDKNILKKVSNNWLSWLGLISSLKFNLGGRHQTPPPSSHFRGIWQRFSSPSSYSTPPVSLSSPRSSSWAWWSLLGRSSSPHQYHINHFKRSNLHPNHHQGSSWDWSHPHHHHHLYHSNDQYLNWIWIELKSFISML